MNNDINNVQQGTQLDPNVKTADVYVTVGRFISVDENTGLQEPRTIVGFGSARPYIGKSGEQINPSIRSVIYQIQQIDAFLKAHDAGKAPIIIAGDRDANDRPRSFVRADIYYLSGTSKDLKPYQFTKLALELQPQIIDQNTGELIQQQQRLTATKTKNGFVFDDVQKNSELIDKFARMCEKGVDFQLSATKHATLSKYPKLVNTINQIDKSAFVKIAFIKQQGAVLMGISPINKDIGMAKTKQPELGQEKLMQHRQNKLNRGRDFGL